MRQLAITLLTFLCFNPCSAQIDIGTKHQNLKKSHIATLQNTTTVFVVQDRDSSLIPYFAKTLSQAWTISPVKVIPFRELPAFANNEQYSLFTFNYMWDLGSTASLTGLRYELLIPDGKKKNGSLDRLCIASYYLATNWSDYDEARSIFNRIRSRNRDSDPATIRYISTQMSYWNWHPSYMAAFFRHINEKLLTLDNTGTKEEFAAYPLLEPLRSDTLLIPVSASVLPIAHTLVIGSPGPEVRSREKILELTRDYPYPIKVVDDADLAHIIMHSVKPVYVLLFTFSLPDKNVSVIEAKEGRLIYLNRVRLSNKLNSDDFARLKKHIGKA